MLVRVPQTQQNRVSRVLGVLGCRIASIPNELADAFASSRVSVEGWIVGVPCRNEYDTNSTRAKCFFPQCMAPESKSLRYVGLESWCVHYILLCRGILAASVLFQRQQVVVGVPRQLALLVVVFGICCTI